MKKSLKEICAEASASVPSADLSISGIISVNEVYPFRSFTDLSVSPAIISHATVHKTTFDHKGRPMKGPDGKELVESFTTVLALTVGAKPQWAIWCRDKFIEGRETGTKLATEDRIKLCAQCAVAPKQAGLTKEMVNLHNSRPVSDSCTFWEKFKADETLCEHTLFFLKQLEQSHPNFEEDALGEYDFIFGIPAAAAAPKAFDFERVVFSTPVGIKGEQGSGKTYDAFQLSKKHGLPLYLVAGHEGVEARDLLGHLVPYAKDLVWKDGGVAAAFRGAQTNKVLLVIDEILRIPTREQTLLLTALSPLDSHYHLRTGRMVSVVDGVGKEEELVVPTKNLLVLVTTNVGSQFAVNEMDPAMEERFVWFYRQTEMDKLRKILAAELTAKSYSKAKLEGLVNFFLKMKDLRAKGMVKSTPSTRPLVRTIQISDVEAEIPDALKAQMLIWVSDTAEGEPVMEQLKSITDIINTVFT